MERQAGRYTEWKVRVGDHRCESLPPEKGCAQRSSQQRNTHLQYDSLMETVWLIVCSRCHRPIKRLQYVQSMVPKWQRFTTLQSTLQCWTACLVAIQNIPTQEQIFPLQQPSKWLHWTLLLYVLIQKTHACKHINGINLKTRVITLN